MTETAPLIEMCGVTKHFGTRGMFGGGRVTRAVDGIDLRIARGETVGLLGESGSGKSTMGRLLLKLLPPTHGDLRFDGQDIATLRGGALRNFRRRAQLVFQNPFEALDPRYTIRRSLAEPLHNAAIPKREHEDRAIRAMQRVRLPAPAAFLDKYPHQLSGGQLQRVVLARALILAPEFIVADEPVSMLDVSVRAGILNVMRDVRDAMGLTAIYISHDIALVRYVCSRTLVMYKGKIVEDGPTEAIVTTPRHPYTRALIAAMPTPHITQSREPVPIRPARPGGIDMTRGCRFRDRCPAAVARCDDDAPDLSETRPGHRVACHFP